jgi:hypothetical protein
MKKLILFFTGILIILTGNAQCSFFKWYPSTTNEYIYCGIEAEDGSFLISGEYSQDFYARKSGYLLKIDAMGNFVQQNITPFNDTSFSHGIIFKIPGETGIVNVTSIGDFMLNDTIIHSNYYSKYTEDFELISSKRFSSPYNFYLYPQAYAIPDNNNVYVLSTILNHYFFPSGINITKYSPQFDSITSHQIDRYGMQSFGLVWDSIHSTLKAFSDVKGDYLFVTRVSQDLQFKEEKNLPYFVSSTCVTALQDTMYLLTGVTDNIAGVKAHIKVKKYNSEDTLIKSIEYYNHPDTVLYSGAVKNTAIIEDKIFIVGVYNVDPGQFPWQTTPTWILVTRIDTSLQILDQHFYGGDAFYIPYHIIKTTDGGALIIGNRYDYNTPWEQKYHIFTLKVNSDGLITELPEHPQAKAHVAAIYPNPGTDYLNIQSGPQITGAQFYIFDLQGKPVCNEKINSTQLKVNTLTLASGTYTWQIVFKNKVIESGKWIKQ